LRKISTSILFVATLLSFVVSAPIFAQPSGEAQAPDEFRGVWITRFEWPNKDPEVCKSNIVRLMEQAAKNGFNAVIFQVRGQADVLYPSAYEPWSPIFGSKFPGFDPLEFALEEAHQRDLEFHAYINAFPVWSGSGKPPQTEPAHLFWTHCQPDSPENWLCCGKDGKPMTEEYYYLSPGIPAVQDYVRKVVIDVARRYNVDGIHLDRIRYPGPGVSHDPISKRRFASANPDGLEWGDWQRDQITRMLNNIYGELLEVKPQINLSCSVWGIYDKTRIPGYSKFSSGYHDYYQDSQRWAQKGVVDAIVPMIYWDIPDPAPNYDTVLDSFVANAGDRFVYGGYHAKYPNFKEIEDEIAYTRKAGAQGEVAFASSYLDKNRHWDQYGSTVYRQPAKTPELTWKTKPETGAIIGRVLTSKSEPVTDAQVRIPLSNYAWLSSGDGFFAILDLAPGEYSVSASRDDLGSETVKRVPVRAGETSRIEIVLSPQAAK